MPQPIILCVDDEKLILDSLETQLQNRFGAEYTIVIAESGEEGLEVIDEAVANRIEIPVILADYLMPGMKGDQFLIQARQKLPEARAILLTGQAGLDEVVTCINQAGLYRYLAKPWELSDLTLTVKEAIASFQQQNIIRLQNAELHKLNQSLEEQVAVRTRELNSQKALFQQVFQNYPSGELIFDSQSRILEVNPAFENILQFSPSEILGKAWLDLIVAPDWQESATKIVNLVLDGQIRRQELNFITKDQRVIPVSLVAFPITGNDSEKLGIIVFNDLTEQRESEELLRRSYERRKRSIFFNELAVGQKELSPESLSQAKDLGINLTASFLVMFLLINPKKALDSTDQDRETQLQMVVDGVIDWLSLKPGIYSWGYQDGVGAIYKVPENFRQDAANQKQAAENLFKRLARDYPEIEVTIGLGEYHSEMERFSERCHQARLAALVGMRIHPAFPVHHYLELGAFPLLTRLINDGEAESFLNRTIGKVIDYDKANGTDLFPTLEKIIAVQNLRVIADEMFLHYKTVLFRKQSIEKILGTSLDSFEGRTLIGTAMALHYLRAVKGNL